METRPPNRDALDALELGVEMVAATLRFRQSVHRLTANADHTRRLVQLTLQKAWQERQSFREDATVHDWLVDVLQHHILN